MAPAKTITLAAYREVILLSAVASELVRNHVICMPLFSYSPPTDVARAACLGPDPLPLTWREDGLANGVWGPFNPLADTPNVVVLH